MKLLRHSLSLLLAVSVCAQEPDRPPPEAAPLHAAFDQLLENRVQHGLVDYAAIRRHDQQALTNYLDTLATVDVARLEAKAQFAFYVNLYNATMIQAVLDHTAKAKDWTPAASDFGVFKEKRVRLKSGTVTLDHLENKILRPQFEDPRVHVALVCGARSCPPLLPRAYRADDLDKLLDANMKAFLRDSTRNRIDAAAKTIHLSKIFEWFQQDFGGEAGVRELVRKEFGDEIASYEIAYLDYSWARNQQPKTGK